MSFLKKLKDDMIRDPVGASIDIAFTIIAYGIGIWLILSASRCAGELVYSAL